MSDISTKLINPNASPAAQNLMNTLAELYGKYILTGQYADKGVNSPEFQLIREVTGQTSAVIGLDFMDDTPSRVARGTTSKTVEHAIEFHKMGGIVTICWHWNAPEEYLTGTWYRAFYTDQTCIDLGKIMRGEDKPGHELLLRDIDAIALQLLRLQEADVPVLWRPLHEAAGAWFWWGAAGPQAQIDLWQLMYERLTNLHGLNNLIWVWNGQHADWYPGDEYVDIIGEDVYSGERVYTSQVERFKQAQAYTNPPKMVVLSENGPLFDPDLAIKDGAMWGFFATWVGNFVSDERYTEQWMLKHVYNHERTLSLEEFQALKEV